MASLESLGTNVKQYRSSARLRGVRALGDDSAEIENASAKERDLRSSSSSLLSGGGAGFFCWNALL